MKKTLTSLLAICLTLCLFVSCVIPFSMPLAKVPTVTLTLSVEPGRGAARGAAEPVYVEIEVADGIITETLLKDNEIDPGTVLGMACTGITGIEANAFKGCTELTTVDFGDALKTIGAGAFKGCENIKAIEFPETVKDLGAGAFEDCDKLETVDFGALETIGAGAFKGCENIKAIEFPETVKELGAGAFEGCTSLETVEFKGENPPTTGDNPFGEQKVIIAVPESASEAYKESDVVKKSENEIMTTSQVRVKVEHYQQKVKGDEYELADTVNIIDYEAGEDVIAEEKEYPGFALNDEKSDAKEAKAAEDLVIKLYYDRNTFTVTFDANDGHGTASAEKTVRYDATVENPADLEATGYTFGGWYKENTCTTPWDFENDTVTDDIRLYAMWSGNEYSITYKDQGGSDLSGTQTDAPAKHTYGSETDLETPTKDGYTFGGWFIESNCEGDAVTTLAADGYTADITLYAKWMPIYKVTFDANGHGKDPDEKTVNVGEKVTDPGDLSEVGYTFDGWYKTKNATTGELSDMWNFDTAVTANMTLYAKWTIITYEVTFNANGYGDAPQAATVNHGAKVVKPDDLKATGHIFGGWYKENTCTTPWDFDNDTVTAATTLFAKWIEGSEVTCTWSDLGGTAQSGTFVIEKGATKIAADDVLGDLAILVLEYRIGDKKIAGADGTLEGSVSSYTDADGKWISSSEVEIAVVRAVNAGDVLQLANKSIPTSYSGGLSADGQASLKLWSDGSSLKSAKGSSAQVVEECSLNTAIEIYDQNTARAGNTYFIISNHKITRIECWAGNYGNFNL